MINVTFVVRDAETKHGQNVYIVGNVLELGKWNVGDIYSLSN